MDKNSLLGLFLIGLILFGFTWYNGRQAEEATKQAKAKAETSVSSTTAQQQTIDTVSYALQAESDSAQIENIIEPERIDTLKNESFTISFTSHGGRIASVELNGYKRLYEPYYGDALSLFNKEESDFGLNFYVKNQLLNTSLLSFKVAEKTDSSIEYRYYADSVHYFAYIYRIDPVSNMVKFDVDLSGIKDIMARNQLDPVLKWHVKAPQQEKGFKNENNYTTIAYKYIGSDEIEELSPSTDSKSEDEIAKLNWLAFKQQFFSSIIIADSCFAGGEFSYRTFDPKDEHIKDYNASLNVPISEDGNHIGMRFYFGPNKFSVMNKYKDISLQKVIPLGGWIVGWISRLVVIPTFDFLSQYIKSYGLIILILTIIIKLVISPLTYKSYLSTAKMRVLKPEMDKISEKYPKQEDAVKKQQAVMALYKSAGVSPMGGCLPILIQFPILWAMFRFFPSAIELRGQSFLWASDLSSYDSIWTFPGGFAIPWYGDHISLFTLLMAVSMYITSKINMATQPQNNAMPGMNFMMLYMMPAMLLIWFNDYASGLTYYYLLSNLFTLGQTLAFRGLIDDAKLHAQMEKNKKKPQKKSKWAAKLEEMQKRAEEQQRRQNRGR